MEIEFLHVADAVDAVNGKLYMLGGCWNQHQSGTFPTNIRAGIAVGLLMTSEEAGTPRIQRLSLEIFAAEGDLVYGQEFEISFEERCLSKNIKHRNIIAVNASFSLPRPGTYLVRTKIDSLEKTVLFEAIPRVER